MFNREPENIPFFDIRLRNEKAKVLQKFYGKYTKKVLEIKSVRVKGC